jgi:hypothetical protein
MTPRVGAVLNDAKGRIASPKLLPNKLTGRCAAAPANLMAGAHDGADQHERTARARDRDSGALSDGRAG